MRPSVSPDKNAVLKFIPHLLNEMLNILTQVCALHQYEPKKCESSLSLLPEGTSDLLSFFFFVTVAEPSLDTYESVMKCSQMLVQAMWDRQSPLLQLPHIQTDMLRHFKARKVGLLPSLLRSLQQTPPFTLTLSF